ncbi:MAG: MFS transporter [Myxococcales bacterium]|nr:MFS transporter [Myxococcales bacterium]
MSGPPPASGSTGESKPARPPAPGAVFALVVLTLMNMLNYVDRWVPSAVKDLFKHDLHLTDAQTSWPLSAFIIVYMLASPVFGALAETRSRRVLIAFGVAAWSLATAAAAFAQGFGSLLLARAAVGIGEAAYATLAPAVLADFFPPERRNRIFTYFYVATPVGSAIGFVLGGFLGEHFGWRTAFLAVGLPGLLVAALALLMKEPARGGFDEAPPRSVSWGQAILTLARNPVYVTTVLGYTAVTFATGGIADWFPTFLSRVRGMPLSQADLAIGVSAVVGGLLGTALGGAAADRLGKVTRQPYLAISGLAMIPATLLTVVALFFLRAPLAIVAAVLTAQIFLWAYNAPVNALLVNSVDPGLRARAFGLSILCIHLLGDVLSPPLIGLVSDRTGNLELALVMVPVAVLLGGLVWLVGWRRLPEVKA